MNRRHFLKALGAVTAAVSLAPKVLTATTLEEATRPYWPGVSLTVTDGTVVRFTTYSRGELVSEQRMFYSAEIIKRLLPQLPLKLLVEDRYRYRDLPRGTALNWRKWESLEIPAERRLSA